MVTDKNMSFNVEKEKSAKTKEILKDVYEALTEKGYNPINQMVGYLMSGDPAYVTSYKNARNIMGKVEREEILEDILEFYIKNNHLN